MTLHETETAIQAVLLDYPVPRDAAGFARGRPRQGPHHVEG